MVVFWLSLGGFFCGDEKERYFATESTEEEERKVFLAANER